MAAEGLAIDTLCVMDTEPREATELERRAMWSLARRVMAQLALRRAAAGLEREA